MGRHRGIFAVVFMVMMAIASLLVASVLPIWSVRYIDTGPTDLSPYGTLWEVLPQVVESARAGRLWRMVMMYWFGNLVQGLAAVALGAVGAWLICRVHRLLAR